MPRTKPTGIPARLVLAGGISRHGSHCGCAYCAPDLVSHQRQAIPVVAAGVLQPPVKLSHDGPNPPTAIDEAFAATNRTIDELVAQRDAREAARKRVLPVEPEHGWSPYVGVAS